MRQDCCPFYYRLKASAFDKANSIGGTFETSYRHETKKLFISKNKVTKIGAFISVGLPVLQPNYLNFQTTAKKC